jgi:hypothetical protein
MKRILRNSIMLSAFLLMALMVEATVIGGSANLSGTGGNASVSGCDGGTDQQAYGVQVKCTKRDGSEGVQCVTEGTGTSCSLKVIDCL